MCHSVCVWGGGGTGDEIYPKKLTGYQFIPLPQPYKGKEKCLKWIKACGWPHQQLNADKVDENRNKVVCNKVSIR